MNDLKIGVIGGGHLGRIHAKLLAGTDGANLAWVADPFETSQAAVREMLDCEVVTHYQDHLDEVDAVIVASPTDTHADVVTQCLKTGKDVLVEKPITINPREADHLVNLSEIHDCVLQVGHVERFNPAFRKLNELGEDVKYIEGVRASSFPGRCLDVGVVLDLMIHDIDLVLSVAQGELSDIRASGLAIITDHEDIAECRLEFTCGLVANLKASRISPEPARAMQLYGVNGFASIDFGSPNVQAVKPCDDIRNREYDLASKVDNPLGYGKQLFLEDLRCEELTAGTTNAIADEQADFVASIRENRHPVVTGQAGADAVRVASEILNTIASRRWSNRPSVAETGPHAYLAPIRRAA
ncbi:MAG: Gfo/Idh/MocA family oxidoreductase [Planctomycetota bacterium]